MASTDIDFDMLLRYGIPGFILLLPLLLTLFADGTTEGNEGMAFLLVFIMIPVGFAVHQLWRLIFDMWGLGYRRGRPNLEYIIEDLDVDDVDEDEVYLAWEYWIYLKGDQLGKLFTKIKQVWHFYHSDMSDSLALLLGATIAYMLLASNPLMKYILILYPLLLLVFLLKSRNLKKEIDMLELYVAKQNKDEIISVFDKIGD